MGTLIIGILFCLFRLVSATPTEQGDTKMTSPRRRYSPPRQQENSKLKSTSLPKLEEDIAVSAVEEKIAGNNT